MENAKVSISGRNEKKSKFAVKHASRAEDHIRNNSDDIDGFRVLLHDPGLGKKAAKTIKRASQLLIGRRFGNRATAYIQARKVIPNTFGPRAIKPKVSNRHKSRWNL